MIAFIDDHRGAYGVEPICKVLPIAPSTYRAHAARHADPAKQPSRAKLDLVLTADIQRVFDANFGVYGVPETFVVDGNGVIRMKHIGPLTPEVLATKIEPLLKKLDA